MPALILCDIDNLKHVNDTGGHAAGDRALVRVAEALVAASRAHEDAVVGRFGGDEFCVILPSGTAEDARAVALDTVRRLERKRQRAPVVRRRRAVRGGDRPGRPPARR